MNSDNASLQGVEASSDILGETLAIAGTRIPVHDVAPPVTAGLPSTSIRDDSGITGGQIEVAVYHAQANPMPDDCTELGLLRAVVDFARHIDKSRLAT